ncbi:MAG TPA: DUF1292 domain-containing protein [Lachnospiraceae bacterium]|nr:DUF1292 domain-containing protein [Lachnospiraceae bacterium]
MSDKKCDCGQDCNCEEQMTVTLSLDNGEDVECAILTIFEAGSRDYIALLPLNGEGEQEGEDVYLYRYLEETGEEPRLENILDDDEYEIAADAFDEWLDSLEYDELDIEE